MPIRYVLVASRLDPVAQAVVDLWGTPPSIGEFVDGAPLRRLAPECLLLQRPGPHIHDELLDARLPSGVLAEHPVLIFPSIHRSERGVAALTVHPIGNPGPTAELGGRPRTVVPTSPRLMTATLRALTEEARGTGLPVTFEATHHGPELSSAAFFVEIGYAEQPRPPEPAVRLLARVLVRLLAHEPDRIAMGVGGGHYAPHFTDLAVRRRWAFGHLLSRHVIESVDAVTAASAYAATPAAEGILFTRAEEAQQPLWRGLGPRLRDGMAPEREARARPADGGPTTTSAA